MTQAEANVAGVAPVGDGVVDAGDHPGPTTGTAPAPTKVRVLAIDAVRGLAIVILLLAVHPGPRDALPAQLEHPMWHGVTFADLFFPLFLFAVGASMPFSASASTGRSVARRATLLTLIGIGLVSAKNLSIIIPGVLQHIAIAYVLAWLVLKLPWRAQVAVCAATVLGFWAAFLVTAGPGADPWSRDGGTFAHAANSWFFGGFRTEGIPQSVISVVNVVAGAFAGRWVLEQPDRRAVLRTAGLWAVGLVAAGLVMAQWVPLNKKLWSPSFTLLTCGTSFGWFALALWAIDMRGWRRWTRPLVELGRNAIAVYVLLMLAFAAIVPHRGPLDDVIASVVPWPTVVSLTWGVIWVALGWWFCHVLHERRIFIKV
ncbi:MAG TPA: heparan-alpha-glucosaminide N-acetyltransferase domain-containing protein [Acidimicrobiales bacterium]|nr:heparan-alpha-glucosaminide N-acetyltransferase domain-containing protein [Acidimicrobiales bacterium]